jgi:hypothetical protein
MTRLFSKNFSCTKLIRLCLFSFADFQKLEREARICRKLQHPNIGQWIGFEWITCCLSLEQVEMSLMAEREGRLVIGSGAVARYE